MRVIVLDTETTGLSWAEGDRLVEIGAVELVNMIPTGQNFHRYINPERPVSEGAAEVHGLTDAFLADKPRFGEIVGEFMAFLGEGDPIVIHNAAFDTGFINAELGRHGFRPLPPERVVDTLTLARRKHPGASNSLDALCARYGIDNSARTKHGALLDAEILAEVYAELLGGRQAVFELSPFPAASARSVGMARPAARRPVPLAPRLSEAEAALHLEWVKSLGGKPIWFDYLSPPENPNDQA